MPLPPIFTLPDSTQPGGQEGRNGAFRKGSKEVSTEGRKNDSTGVRLGFIYPASSNSSSYFFVCVFFLDFFRPSATLISRLRPS